MKVEAVPIDLDHPFLKSLRPEHLKILGENALPAHFEAGEMIFREGEIANRFYLIKSGRVALESKTPGGTVLIDQLGEGDVLGWSWLFPPYFWRLDARALETTEAMFFYGTRLREQCEDDHDLGWELMRRLAEVVIRRMQATRRQLVQCYSLQSLEQLAQEE